MPMSDEERKKLAQDIVKAFFNYVDLSIGTSLRKKLVYIVVALILVAGIATGIIHLPKAS